MERVVSIGIVGASIFLFAFLLAHLIYGFGIVGWVIFLVLLVLWLSGLTIGLFVVRTRKRGYGTALAVALSSLLLLPLGVWMATGSALFALFLLWAYWLIENDRETFRKLRMVRIAKRSMPKIATGFIVLLAIFYGLTAADILRQDDVEIIPRPLVEAVAVPFEGVTVGELQEDVGIAFVEDSDVLEQTVSAFLHEMVNESLRAIIAPYRNVAPLFFIVGIFFVLKALSVPLIWIALLAAWLLQRLLVRAGVLTIRTVPSEEEQLVLAE